MVKNFLIGFVLFFIFSFLLVCHYWNWLKENASGIEAISAIATIGLALTTIYFAYQTYLFEKIRIFQPHSRRIAEKAAEVVKEMERWVYDPREMRESWQDDIHFLIPLDLHPYFESHFRTGYSEIYSLFLTWRKNVKIFNTSLINFVNNSLCDMEEWLKKETKNENFEELVKEFYKRRVINYCFKKILIPLFPNPFHKKASLQELSETHTTELQWSGATIIRANPILVVALENFINNFIKMNKQKVWEFYHDFEKLSQEKRKIMEEISTKLIDKASLGGIIKGSCDACEEIVGSKKLLELVKRKVEELIEK
ncbi:MAG: hypothetical protein ABIK66_05445 [candidate division WOR-3 bacterium]